MLHQAHAKAGPQIANAMAIEPEQSAKRRQVSLDNFSDVSASAVSVRLAFQGWHQQ